MGGKQASLVEGGGEHLLHPSVYEEWRLHIFLMFGLACGYVAAAALESG